MRLLLLTLIILMPLITFGDESEALESHVFNQGVKVFYREHEYEIAELLAKIWAKEKNEMIDSTMRSISKTNELDTLRKYELDKFQDFLENRLNVDVSLDENLKGIIDLSSQIESMIDRAPDVVTKAAFLELIPNVFQICFKDDLIEKIQSTSSDQIEWSKSETPLASARVVMEYKGDNKLSVQVYSNLDVEHTGDDLNNNINVFVDTLKPLGGMKLPIILKGQDGIERQIENNVAYYQGLLSKVLVDGWRLHIKNIKAMVFMAFHEFIESIMVADFISSEDRRWFCEGTANYLTYEFIKMQWGESEAETWLDLEQNLIRYEPYRAQLDLENWKLFEDQTDKEKSGDLEKARYEYATKAIFDITNKYGPNIIYEIFEALRLNEKGFVDMDTVYEAFEQKTGDRLQDYLIFQK